MRRNKFEIFQGEKENTLEINSLRRINLISLVTSVRWDEIKEARFAFLRYRHASNYAMANGKEARNGEERRRERATATSVEEENRREGRLGWLGGRVARVAVVASLSAASQRRRCAICSQQEKPELIKARNYLRFEPFVLTGVSCPI